MKRFKIKELIVKLPTEGFDKTGEFDGKICKQVTLLECPGGATRVDPGPITDGPVDPCQQVTLLNCANQATRIQCELTQVREPCQQVTLIDCANGVTKQTCDGRTMIVDCQQVTYPNCNASDVGVFGTFYGPRCGCGGCSPIPCTKTEPTTLETCPVTGNANDDAALFVVTREIDRMPLESLSVLKSQLSDVLRRTEEAEKKYTPSTPQELDAAEAQLKEALAEVEKLRAEMKNKSE
ncbi:hypothetical protein CKO11_03425 [Rhodobacter sp. TJ_12]|uniref:tropomyosin n=1 Tax=Rhodobacter sp. TJ_12 TaxID=2029399 RepID=UPI001CC011A0|nr:tropomyosin [Rhodobacter sp. TJ_12]MBZ4021507.1 hypothetical protein [Rhodobacter sp. TJ_12]